MNLYIYIYIYIVMSGTLENSRRGDFKRGVKTRLRMWCLKIVGR